MTEHTNHWSEVEDASVTCRCELVHPGDPFWRGFTEAVRANDPDAVPIPVHVDEELPRASVVRVTPLDDEGNSLGEPFTTFSHVSVEFALQPPVDYHEYDLRWPSILLGASESLTSCIRVHGDHESEYGPDAHGVLHWRCVRCWIDRCLPGDCPDA